MSVVVLSPEELQVMLNEASKQGAMTALSIHGSMSGVDPDEPLGISWIADKFKIHRQTILNRIKDKAIQVVKNPNNRKEFAIPRKHLYEIIV
jgi:hypothetical protein